MMPANLRILLVEDDELFRLGLCLRLQQETGLQVVAEASNGEAALALAKSQILDIVLLDIGLPGGIGGFETCQLLRQQYPQLPILVLTSRSEPSLIARLIAAGAQGYCIKGIATETLVLALRSVAAGACWWDRACNLEIRAAFGSQYLPLNPPATILTNHLTGRELEILTLIAAGKTNAEIAEILRISSGTVRVHVHAILQKLEVRDRTQAAVLALQKGLVVARDEPNLFP